MRRTFMYPEGLVEVVDNRRLQENKQRIIDHLAASLSRPRVLDVQPVAVFDLGSRPLARSTREGRRRAKRRRS